MLFYQRLDIFKSNILSISVIHTRISYNIEKATPDSLIREVRPTTFQISTRSWLSPWLIPLQTVSNLVMKSRPDTTNQKTQIQVKHKSKYLIGFMITSLSTRKLYHNHLLLINIYPRRVKKDIWLVYLYARARQVKLLWSAARERKLIILHQISFQSSCSIRSLTITSVRKRVVVYKSSHHVFLFSSFNATHGNEKRPDLNRKQE